MAIVLNGDTGISSIGTLTGVTSISSASDNTPVVLQDSSSNTNTCRAWVNFNGADTVAIRASFNVSSITDNGTGDYTVNFTTAMPDANYSVTAMSYRASGVTTSFCSQENSFAPTTSAFRFGVFSNAGSPVDSPFVSVAVFR
jgi:hypothetical protein